MIFLILVQRFRYIKKSYNKNLYNFIIISLKEGWDSFMYKVITYGNKKLDQYVEERHIIPYSLSPKDRFEKNNYYFIDFNGKIIKVLFVKYYRSGELEGLEVKYNNNMHSYICTDIDPGYDYLLKKDYNDLFKKDIINDGLIHTGAEIKYWFFMNKISCFDKKYRGFWKLVDPYSPRCISDYNKYFLTADIDSDVYFNCRIFKINDTGI